MTAKTEYETLLTEAPEGISLNKKSFYRTEEIILSGIKKGQHLYHIIKTNDLAVFSSAVYRNIHKGYYSVANIDLQQAVKFKPRCTSAPKKIPKAIRKGCAYEEFQMFCGMHNIHSYVELDTIIGNIGGKVILTIHFTSLTSWPVFC